VCEHPARPTRDEVVKLVREGFKADQIEMMFQHRYAAHASRGEGTSKQRNRMNFIKYLIRLGRLKR
jgi:hypothetical protein